MLIGLLVGLGFIEIYGIAMAILQKKERNRLWWVSLFPFAAFHFLDRELHGFTVCTIRVKSMLVSAISMAIVALLAYLVAFWGQTTLPPHSAEPLEQLMYVPLGFAAIVLYLCMAKTTSDLLFLHRNEFRGDLLVSLLLLPIPFLIAFIHPKEAQS